MKYSAAIDLGGTNIGIGIVSEEVLNESVLFPPIKNLAYTVFPYLKELLFWNK